MGSEDHPAFLPPLEADGLRRTDRDRLSKSARHSHIVAQVTAARMLRASELADWLGVSGETIRRDLMELHDRKLIDRTYGGAARPFAHEQAVGDRKAVMVAERQAIAAAVVAMIQPKEVLMIGAGATTCHVARALAAQAEDITVITHDFAIAHRLGTNRSIRVLFCPGRYHASEGYVFGAQTISSINGYEANRAIVGATGIGARGIHDADDEAGAIYGAMVKRASEAILIADRTKFEQRALTVYAQWTDIDRLVTDSAPVGPLAEALRAAGTEVIVAAPSETSTAISLRR
jgi:DeoR/GlpR family transcriptional regulator of sugar metabolism